MSEKFTVSELYDCDMAVVVSSLIEVYANVGGVAEWPDEAVDSVVVRLPVFSSIEVVAVNHQVKQWNVLVLMFVEVFLDVEGFDGKLISINEHRR